MAQRRNAAAVANVVRSKVYTVAYVLVSEAV
jgi:hypothetical protein